MWARTCAGWTYQCGWCDLGEQRLRIGICRLDMLLRRDRDAFSQPATGVALRIRVRRFVYRAKLRVLDSPRRRLRHFLEIIAPVTTYLANCSVNARRIPKQDQQYDDRLTKSASHVLGVPC